MFEIDEALIYTDTFELDWFIPRLKDYVYLSSST